MKSLNLINAGLLLFAIASLPIKYCTFLSIVISMSLIVIIVTEFEKGIILWLLVFGLNLVVLTDLFHFI